MSDEFNYASEGEQFEDLPTTFITIRPSGGEAVIVPTTEPITLGTALERANLTFGAATEFWLNSARLQMTDIVPVSSTILAVGTTKGG